MLSVSDGWAKVLRGLGGSKTAPHAPGVTVWVGRPDQFYVTDPYGQPPDAVLVSPYINTATGDVFFAQGDAVPVNGTAPIAARWWQKQTTVFDVGALGVRTSVPSPTSST